jgi:two-component system, sensor histidine kinase PdtaS
LPSETQKSLLLEELSHRTKNDLFMVSSVLTLQARAQSDPNVRAALQAAVARVAVIARAQERLRGDNDGGSVEMAAYLEDLCRTLGDMLRDVRPIAVLVSADKLEVNSSDAVSIGLIVNELVTNAIKYAFPDDRGGTVKVSLSQTGGGVELVVEDDGVGCPPEPSQGMGSRLALVGRSDAGRFVARPATCWVQDGREASGPAAELNRPSALPPT